MIHLLFVHMKYKKNSIKGKIYKSVDVTNQSIWQDSRYVNKTLITFFRLKICYIHLWKVIGKRAMCIYANIWGKYHTLFKLIATSVYAFFLLLFKIDLEPKKKFILIFIQILILPNLKRVTFLQNLSQKISLFASFSLSNSLICSNHCCISAT